MALPQTFNFQKWIDENRHLLKPPVGNREVYPGHEFIVMVVGGPNSRTDFHVDPAEEFFYQLEGDIALHVLVDGKREIVPIREGEIFLLPPNVPHSPQRPPNTIGLVLERRRLPHEKDSFLWVCEKCGQELYRESIHLTDIVQQLPPVFDHFYGDEKNVTCRHCGTRATRA